MNRITIKSDGTSFEAALHPSTSPQRAVLFAAGSGGNPERHLALLNDLANNNCTVIAPYFERIISPIPSAEQLIYRRDLLSTALDFINDLNLPVVGVGHSIGATLLVALAGGQLWLGPDHSLPTIRDERLSKLVLITPPQQDFFKLRRPWTQFKYRSKYGEAPRTPLLPQCK